MVCAAVLVATAPGLVDPSEAADVKCDIPGGDATGWAVATGGDFDGDGQDDVAAGAPCAHVGGDARAGRVLVFSGADGRKLFQVTGEHAAQRLGSAVSFLEDTNDDGRDELIVGSFGWDAFRDGASPLDSAGKVEVYTIDGDVLVSFAGQFSLANVGEAVAGLTDLSGDGVADFLVGAGDDRSGGVKVGRAYLLSGADGSELDRSTGVSSADSWGSTVAAAGDVDGDEVPDVIVGSNVADLLAGGGDLPPAGENNGIVKLLSGADLTQEITIVAGFNEDKLGRAVAPIGAAGLYAGVPGSDPFNRSKAGVVRYFGWDGILIDEYTEPAPEVTAAFGTSLAALEDIDGLGSLDLVAGAPTGSVGGNGGAGRVHALSAETGQPLWSLAGTRPGEAFGQALASGTDFDDDGVADVVIGAPGDDPGGRRGAGSVRVVSGVDGSDIMTLKGRRGLETRLFIAGWRGGRVAYLGSFGRKGRRREVRTPVFRRLRSGTLSIGVLFDSGAPTSGGLALVVGTGTGADDDTVRVISAGRRRRVISQFAGIGAGYAGGVSIAGGDVAGDAVEEIVVAQADSDDGNAVVRIYEVLDVDPRGRINWLQRTELVAFAADDVIEFDVDAGGANVAVGNVVADLAPEGEEEVVDPKEEIVVGPVSGAPVVRVMNDLGVVLGEWLAYAPDQNDGISVAVGDLDGDGVDEILTTPAAGLPWVKAFSADGTPFVPAGSTSAVSFFAFPASFAGGARVAVADVDLDGRPEIVVASGPGMPGIVKAFELDGSAVSDWRDFSPLGPVARGGLVIASTDSFLRH